MSQSILYSPERVTKIQAMSYGAIGARGIFSFRTVASLHLRTMEMHI